MVLPSRLLRSHGFQLDWQAEMNMCQFTASPTALVPVLPQLKALGAKISLDGPEPFVIFQKASNRKIPLQYGRAGHLLLNIADWNPVNVSTKEIEVFALHGGRPGVLEMEVNRGFFIGRNKSRFRDGLKKQREKVKLSGRS